MPRNRWQIQGRAFEPSHSSVRRETLARRKTALASARPARGRERRVEYGQIFPTLRKGFQTFPRKIQTFPSFSKEIPNIILGGFQRNQRVGGDAGRFRLSRSFRARILPRWSRARRARSTGIPRRSSIASYHTFGFSAKKMSRRSDGRRERSRGLVSACRRRPPRRPAGRGARSVGAKAVASPNWPFSKRPPGDVTAKVRSSRLRTAHVMETLIR